MQTPHIAIDPGNPEKAGMAVDQLFKTRGVEIPFSHQIDQHARIEIAAARAHDHPAGWRQSHAGVDGVAIFDGCDTRAIAEVRNDDPVRPIGSELAQDRLARQTVKSVALDALGSQLQRNRQGSRDIRHSGVKRRIEAGHLRQSGEVLTGEANDRQRRRIVQWREGDCRFDLPKHRVVDQAMGAKMRPTMHHAMPDRDRLNLFAVCEQSSRCAQPRPAEFRNLPLRKPACLPLASFAQNFPSLPPIDSASPESSTFGMDDSTW